MKKLILILTIGLGLISCNKEEITTNNNVVEPIDTTTVVEPIDTTLITLKVNTYVVTNGNPNSISTDLIINGVTKSGNKNYSVSVNEGDIVLLSVWGGNVPGSIEYGTTVRVRLEQINYSSSIIDEYWIYLTAPSSGSGYLGGSNTYTIQ